MVASSCRRIRMPPTQGPAVRQPHVLVTNQSSQTCSEQLESIGRPHRFCPRSRCAANYVRSDGWPETARCVGKGIQRGYGVQRDVPFGPLCSQGGAKHQRIEQVVWTDHSVPVRPAWTRRRVAMGEMQPKGPASRRRMPRARQRRHRTNAIHRSGALCVVLCRPHHAVAIPDIPISQVARIHERCGSQRAIRSSTMPPPPTRAGHDTDC